MYCLEIQWGKNATSQMSFAARNAIIYNLRLDSNRTVCAEDIYNLYNKHHCTIFIFPAEVASPFCTNNYFLSSYFLWQLSSPVFPVHLSSTLRAGSSSPPATAPSLTLPPLPRLFIYFQLPLSRLLPVPRTPPCLPSVAPFVLHLITSVLLSFLALFTHTT